MLVCLDRDLGDGLLPSESGFVPSLKAAGPYRQTDRTPYSLILSLPHPFITHQFIHPLIRSLPHTFNSSFVMYQICTGRYRPVRCLGKAVQALGLCFPGSTDQDAHHA